MKYIGTVALLVLAQFLMEVPGSDGDLLVLGRHMLGLMCATGAGMYIWSEK